MSVPSFGWNLGVGSVWHLIPSYSPKTLWLLLPNLTRPLTLIRKDIWLLGNQWSLPTIHNLSFFFKNPLSVDHLANQDLLGSQRPSSLVWFRFACQGPEGCMQLQLGEWEVMAMTSRITCMQSTCTIWTAWNIRNWRCPYQSLLHSASVSLFQSMWWSSSRRRRPQDDTTHPI